MNSTAAPTGAAPSRPRPATDPSECQICQLPFAAIPCNGPLNRECVFCQKVSSRADSARRHEQTCRVNNPGHPYHRVYKRGRKTKACDACSRIKVACDAKAPCQRCSARQLECTYGRLCNILAHRQPPGRSQQRCRTAAERHRVEDQELDETRRIHSPFQFLLNCTDPRVNFVNDVIVPGEPERDPAPVSAAQTPQERFLAANAVPAQGPLAPAPVTIDPQLLVRGFMDPYLGLSLDDGSMDGSMFNIGAGLDNDFNAALAPRYWTTGLGTTAKNSIKPRVIQLEAEMLQMVAQYDPNTAEKHYATVKDFFGRAEFHRLFAIFFRRQQLLAKMIHWPTFDARTNEVGLLLAIAMCGVAYSQSSPTITRSQWLPAGDTSDSIQLVAAAAKMQPLAEEFIFRRLEAVCGDVDDNGKVPFNGDHNLPLEACQAAYLIVLLQISVNDKDNTTRRRAMTKRQPALVDAIRRLGMMSKTNGPHAPTPLPIVQGSIWAQNTPWRVFAYNESCTRLALWAVFTDGLLALFCNRPPTTSMAEMVGDLPCSDALWDAASPEAHTAACEQQRQEEQQQLQQLQQQTQQPQNTRLSMKSVMTALMSDDDNQYAVCADLTVFHLYAVVGALQFVLFNYRSQSLPPSMAVVLLRALDRWDRLWHAALARVAPDQQRWLGVAKHSPEFARIARRIVEVSLAAAATTTDEAGAAGRRSKYMQCQPELDLGVFHQFILEHGV